MHWPSHSPGNHEGSAFPWFNVSRKSDRYGINSGHSVQFDSVTIISLFQDKKKIKKIGACGLFVCG